MNPLPCHNQPCSSFLSSMSRWYLFMNSDVLAKSENVFKCYALYLLKNVLKKITYGRNRAGISRKINIFMFAQKHRVGNCQAFPKRPKPSPTSKNSRSGPKKPEGWAMNSETQFTLRELQYVVVYLIEVMVGVIAPQAPRFCTTISFCRWRRRKKSILNRRRRRKFWYI